jgi:peptide deformylase
MSIKKYPDPILDKVSSLAHENMSVKEIHALSKKMREACWDVKGFGISAVQIGEPVQIFGMYSIKKNDLIWITDAEIISSEGKSSYTEGCLSIPGYFWNIVRPEKVTLSYKTLNGDEKVKTFSGVEARIIQHELDHFDGILIPDLMNDEQYMEFNFNFSNKISIYDYEAPELFVV